MGVYGAPADTSGVQPFSYQRILLLFQLSRLRVTQVLRAVIRRSTSRDSSYFSVFSVP